MADAGPTDALAPAAKRRRVDDAEAASAGTGSSKKYEDLWLEDGNITLQCTNGAFRVHRSLLTAQSEVFRDMFALATPTAGRDDAIR